MREERVVVHREETGVPDLHSVLPELTNIDRIRRHAIELRKKGLSGLADFLALKDKDLANLPGRPPYWSGSRMEEALLLQVQARWPQAFENVEGSSEMPPKLDRLKLVDLVPAGAPKHDKQYPVLTAARVLEALVRSPKFAFSRQSILCYYAILRELHTALAPDWSVGGARADQGGRSTAFVTSGCIKAVALFAEANARTATFLIHSAEFQEKLSSLKRMNELVRGRKVVDQVRADEVERLSLAWHMDVVNQIATSTLDLDELLANDFREPSEYLDRLDDELLKKFQGFLTNFRNARREILEFRRLEKRNSDAEFRPDEKRGETSEPQPLTPRQVAQSETAHCLAVAAVDRAIEEASTAIRTLKEAIDSEDKSHRVLFKLGGQFHRISGDIREILKPAGEYVRTILDRELSAAAAASEARVTWHPHELVFAATATGALNNWRDDEKLSRATTYLAEAIDQNGRFSVLPPIHSTPGGSTVHPLNVEVVKAMAQLIENTRSKIGPDLVTRMFQAYEETSVRSELREPAMAGMSASRPSPESRLWCSENGPVPATPAVWVSAIAVQSLDRFLRMLDQRINDSVLEHFSVRKPENFRGRDLNLGDLIIPDHGLVQVRKQRGDKGRPTWSIGVELELMRAHLGKVKLSKKLGRQYGSDHFSLLLHGPPGTGKTTLITALAKSSRAPLVEISPSDIAQSGVEGIERRARDTFEALSMLTGVVIMFDEFEPILKKREVQAKGKVDMFNLLTPGMLPKLTKLYESAKRRWSVYCLVTNHREFIDSAAIRPGRFDNAALILPPDPVSRLGAFLRGLVALDELRMKPEALRRLLRACAASRGQQASALVSQWLFIPKRDLPRDWDGSSPLAEEDLGEVTRYIRSGGKAPECVTKPMGSDTRQSGDASSVGGPDAPERQPDENTAIVRAIDKGADRLLRAITQPKEPPLDDSDRAARRIAEAVNQWDEELLSVFTGKRKGAVDEACRILVEGPSL